MTAGRLDHAELLDALTTGVVLLDGAYTVRHANVAAQGLLAMSLTKAHGKPFVEFFADANGLPGMLQRARERREVIAEREVGLRTVDAPRELRVFDVTVTPIESAVGDTDLLLEIDDATQRSRLNRDSELRARLDGSRLMTRQLAHEIKNPIGGLRGAAQLLERVLPEVSQREYTKIIIAEADRLTALIDNMTGPARPPNKQLLNLHEVCEHVHRLLRAEAPRGASARSKRCTCSHTSCRFNNCLLGGRAGPVMLSINAVSRSASAMMILVYSRCETSGSTRSSSCAAPRNPPIGFLISCASWRVMSRLPSRRARNSESRLSRER